MTSESRELDWTAYAQVYDLMTENNPAYQDILLYCMKKADTWTLPAGSKIVDLCGGTGNFSIPLAKRFPQCQVIHVDANSGMNAVAAQKAAEAGIRNHQTVTQEAETLHFPPESIRALVTVHALYALPEPAHIIKKISTWLMPEGNLFACDIGRVLYPIPMLRYLLRETIRRKGLWTTLGLLRRSLPSIWVNTRAAGIQKKGDYWTHTTSEYREAFERAGLVVEEVSTWYRGLSDLVVCRKAVAGADTHSIDNAGNS